MSAPAGRHGDAGEGSLSRLLAKYDVPVPRYTSYPPVPHWQDVPSPDAWCGAFGAAIAPPEASLALYVHLPFCRTLCTFCGCNTVITRNEERSEPYVEVVLAELDLYLARLPALGACLVSELHLGGGTPTFLPPRVLDRLLRGLAERLPRRADGFLGSVEVDPRVTSSEHLDVLRGHRLTRISLGVQDVDEQVLRLVNRPQPVELTARLVERSRALGYSSINLDLIYGLPGQTVATMEHLATEVLALRPDRLAVYGFARVPWIKPAQRKFKDEDVPAGAAKRRLYETLRERLLGSGYLEIGMDHFALPHDALARAAQAGSLHRNFMGYTDRHSSALLGLGVSGISETPSCYHQNEKVITVYERRVLAGELPTLRGHTLSEDDRRRAARILSLMTTGAAALDEGEADEARQRLADLLADGLVAIEPRELRLTAAGRPFVRLAAAFFDAYLRRAPREGPTYSRAV